MSMHLRSITAAFVAVWIGLAGCTEDTGTSPSESCEELDCAGQHRGCEEGQGCGDCLDGYKQGEDGQCVEATRCADLDCAAQNRVCTESSGGEDATCGDCVTGYVDEQGACVRDEAAVCEPADDPNSIVEECADQFRDCVEATDAGPAECGDCEQGYKPDPSGGDACVPFDTCDDISCSDGEFCLKPEDGDAVCETNPCPDGEAVNGFGECVTCANEGFEGCTDDDFAQASGANRCVCKTEPGWFWNPGLTPARPDTCDKDGDGWVDQQAAEFYNDSTKPVIQAAANCDWHIIDRFELVNDVDGDDHREVTVSELSGGALTQVVLKESVRNDDPSRFEQSNLPDYGGTKFEPRNLNSLTKVCVNTNADFNDNGSADLVEVQKTNVAATPGDVFARMTYFIEAAEGYFVPSDSSDEPGKYVIREFARGSQLPMSYSSEAGDYWKTCTRFPDVRTAESNERERIGTDFGQYTPASGSSIWSEDDGWKGMNHSSQFKCVKVLAVEPDPVDDGAHVVLKDEFAGGSSAEWAPGYAPNVCRLTGHTRDDSDAPAGVANSVSPEITCDVTTPVTEGVKWAAVNYQAVYGKSLNNGATRDDYQYTRGCADECVGRRPLCTGMSSPTVSDESGSCYTDADNFGKRYCGCNITFGGVNCDFGCSSQDDVFISPDYNPGNRAGQFWMCGQVTESEAGELTGVDVNTGDDLRVTGHVPQGASDRASMCEDPDDCNNGLSVR